jgi:hypothetical protein
MSTITSLGAGDNGSTSRGVINTNFTNLNTDKVELTAGGTTLSSTGNVDLILKTGNATTGTITIVDGAAGDITISPNTGGSLVVNSPATASEIYVSSPDTNSYISNYVTDTSTQLIGFDGSSSSSFDLNAVDGSTYLRLTDTDAGVLGPTIELYHNSASPAVNDTVGWLAFAGEDSAGNKQNYAFIKGVITDPTSTSEDGKLSFRVVSAGALADRIEILGSATAGIIQSAGNTDLTLQTGNSTTGSITIVDGADGAINLQPNGTGEAQVNGEQILTEALIKRVYKSADETVNNSGVMQNDDHLLFSIGANEVWAYEMLLLLNSGETPDFKFDFTYPSGTVIRYVTQTSTTSVVEGNATFTISGTTGNDRYVNSRGVITASSTAGTINLRWAQFSADPTDTKVLAGSHIIAHRLA